MEKDLILKLLLNLHNHLAHIAGSYLLFALHSVVIDWQTDSKAL